jgi:hypothetical protein
MSSSLHKEMIKDGVGMHWEQSSMGDKEPDYVLSNSGNRLTFLAI